MLQQCSNTQELINWANVIPSNFQLSGFFSDFINIETIIIITIIIYQNAINSTVRKILPEYQGKE